MELILDQFSPALNMGTPYNNSLDESLTKHPGSAPYPSPGPRFAQVHLMEIE